MSLGSSEEAHGHNRGLSGGNEEVLGALLGVNQKSFEDLACLVGAQGEPKSPKAEPRAP